MKVSCEVSLGELLDKLAILKIKGEMIKDKEKLVHVFNEEQSIERVISTLGLKDLAPYLTRLVEVNRRLWKIEDDIRLKEREKNFGPEFVELARSVYVTNDQRFVIKNEINSKYGSNLKEVKSYEGY